MSNPLPSPPTPKRKLLQYESNLKIDGAFNILLW